MFRRVPLILMKLNRHVKHNSEIFRVVNGAILKWTGPEKSIFRILEKKNSRYSFLTECIQIWNMNQLRNDQQDLKVLFD